MLFPSETMEELIAIRPIIRRADHVKREVHRLAGWFVRSKIEGISTDVDEKTGFVSVDLWFLGRAYRGYAKRRATDIFSEKVGLSVATREALRRAGFRRCSNGYHEACNHRWYDYMLQGVV